MEKIRIRDPDKHPRSATLPDWLFKIILRGKKRYFYKVVNLLIFLLNPEKIKLLSPEFVSIVHPSVVSCRLSAVPERLLGQQLMASELLLHKLLAVEGELLLLLPPSLPRLLLLPVQALLQCPGHRAATAAAVVLLASLVGSAIRLEFGLLRSALVTVYFRQKKPRIEVAPKNVVDPHWFQCGSGSSFLPLCGSGSPTETSQCGSTRIQILVKL